MFMKDSVRGRQRPSQEEHQKESSLASEFLLQRESDLWSISSFSGINKAEVMNAWGQS